jgi:hypothetical protein
MEQGLDLGRLVRTGISQPFHVSDLETLKSLPDGTQEGSAGTRRLLARVPGKRFSALLEKTAGQGVDAGAVWSAFAAASLRTAQDRDTIVVRLDAPVVGQSAFFGDPDLVPLSLVASTTADSEQIVLRDLTASRITEVTLNSADAPALTITRDGDDYLLALEFTGTQFSANAAIQLIEGFAARLDEPLRHLL